MPHSYTSVSPSPKPVEPNSVNQTVVINTMFGLSAILIPSCIVLGAVLYKKYRAYRATLLYQQIETLERLWRISPKQ